jgi:hypothetical protein
LAIFLVFFKDFLRIAGDREAGSAQPWPSAPQLFIAAALAQLWRYPAHCRRRISLDPHPRAHLCAFDLDAKRHWNGLIPEGIRRHYSSSG